MLLGKNYLVFLNNNFSYTRRYFYCTASFLKSENGCNDPMDIFIHGYELSSIPTEDERRRFAWIPSAKTKNTLEKALQMNHTLPKDMLTMPGVDNISFVCVH